jgi:hypothetical protein
MNVAFFFIIGDFFYSKIATKCATYFQLKVPPLCASYQEVIDILVITKITARACKLTKIQDFIM